MGRERGEIRWAKQQVSWRRIETNRENLRRVKTRRESLGRVEKSREEVKRVEVRGERWNNFESCWQLQLLKRVAKIEKSWDGLRRPEEWWSQLKREETKWRRTQRTELRSCEKCRCSSYRQNLFSRSYSSTLLIIGNFRRPACPGFTCIFCTYVYHQRKFRSETPSYGWFSKQRSLCPVGTCRT